MGKVSMLAAGTATDPDAGLLDAFVRWQDAREHNRRVDEEEIAAELLTDARELVAEAAHGRYEPVPPSCGG